MSIRPAALLLIALTAACAPAAEWHGTIEERDGVTYVGNPRVGMWQARESEPLRFELEQVFGVEQSPEAEIIGTVAGVTVDGVGNVYVYDDSYHRLLSFTADGALRWTGGREGQGPGEFNGAEGIAWDGGSIIYVANANRMRLDAWSVDGAFLHADLLGERGLPTGRILGLVGPKRLAFQSFLHAVSTIGGTFGIIEIGDPHEEVAEVDVDAENRDHGPNLALVGFAASGGFVTAGDADSYDLRFYDRDGVLVRVVSREFEEMVGYAADDRRAALRSWLFPPVELEGGYWLARSMWVDPAVTTNDTDQSPEAAVDDSQWRSGLDLFDAEGRFLYSMVYDGRVPAIGRIEMFGPDGKLYTTVYDPFPQVRRYRVEIDGR
jgi:hypothetical protein